MYGFSVYINLKRTTFYNNSKNWASKTNNTRVRKNNIFFCISKWNDEKGEEEEERRRWKISENIYINVHMHTNKLKISLWSFAFYNSKHNIYIFRYLVLKTGTKESEIETKNVHRRMRKTRTKKNCSNSKRV